MPTRHQPETINGMSLLIIYSDMTADFIVRYWIYCVFFTTCGFAQVYLTKTEALGMHLGDQYARKTVFLTSSQRASIEERAKAKVESQIITYYESAQGVAFIETKQIRTMTATFMVVLNSKGIVRAVEMLAFYEPEDYLPSKKWMATFNGKTLSDDLWLKRGVYNISGATLSAYAVTESIRKIIAQYQIAILKDHQ